MDQQKISADQKQESSTSQQVNVAAGTSSTTDQKNSTEAQQGIPEKKQIHVPMAPNSLRLSSESPPPDKAHVDAQEQPVTTTMQQSQQQLGSRQALQQLVQVLDSPSTLEQQDQILNILKNNPPFMAAFIKQRQLLQAQSVNRLQHRPGVPTGSLSLKLRLSSRLSTGQSVDDNGESANQEVQSQELDEVMAKAANLLNHVHSSGLEIAEQSLSQSRATTPTATESPKSEGNLGQDNSDLSQNLTSGLSQDFSVFGMKAQQSTSQSQLGAVKKEVKMEIEDASEETKSNQNVNHTRVKTEVVGEPMDHVEEVSEPMQEETSENGKVLHEPSLNLLDLAEASTSSGCQSNLSVSDIHILSPIPDPAVASTSSEDQPGFKFEPDELRKAFMPVLDRLYKQDPESLLFREIVDPKDLGVPEYSDVVKKSMDLSTIKTNLDQGLYTDAWQFVDDVWLMFENAWLFNDKDSIIYKYCNTLSEVFEKEIDPVMQALGFCCGRKYAYSPQVLRCFGNKLCTIPRNSVYYSSQNSGTNVEDDKYTFCKFCFENVPGDEVRIDDDSAQPPSVIKKEKFQEMKNNHVDPEPFVSCNDCKKKFHQICVLHLDEIWLEGYTCDKCFEKKGTTRNENKFIAKSLPETKLSSFIETRVNDYLKKKEAGAGEVTIRVLSSSDKFATVKPGMKSCFVDNGKMPEKFPYRAKAIFAFQKIDDVDVCFFGMHVQEYGSECPKPNARRVFIGFFDSVKIFRPQNFRTQVYHEIMLGYLQWVKKLGFAMAHIWACPPSEEDGEYIFHCHPKDQKILKPKRLVEWNKEMLFKGMFELTVVDFKDIIKQAKDDKLSSVTDLPYFDGDFWSNVLEDYINGFNEINKDSNISLTGESVLNNIFEQMNEHQDVFFFIKLHSVEYAAKLEPIKDPDPLIPSYLMDGRDSYLTMSKENYHEFSSLRRAKYSTMFMLYELHDERSDKILHSCNKCKCRVKTRYHCTLCKDFNLCVDCKDKEKHPHPMEKLGLDLEEGADGIRINAQEARKFSIQRCIQSLVHACQCKDAECKLASCARMKRVVTHIKACKRRTHGGCPICKQLVALCCHHARTCPEPKCPVPFCYNIKTRLKQQQQHQRLQQAQLVRRRMAAMTARANEAATASTSRNTTVGSIPVVGQTQPNLVPKPGEGLRLRPPSELLQPGLAAAVDKIQATGAAASPSIAEGTKEMHNQPQALNLQQQNQLPSAAVVSNQILHQPPNIAGTAPQVQVGYFQAQQPQQQFGTGVVGGNTTNAIGKQALQELMQTLKSPNTPEQQNKILHILKCNPPLMAAFIKQRQALAQQQHNQQQWLTGTAGSKQPYIQQMLPPPRIAQIPQATWSYQQQQPQQNLTMQQRIQQHQEQVRQRLSQQEQQQQPQAPQQTGLNLFSPEQQMQQQQWFNQQQLQMTQQQTAPIKEWQKSVTPELRTYISNKLLTVMKETNDVSVQWAISLEESARKIETEIYELADTRSHYYHLLAEKIFQMYKKKEGSRQSKASTTQTTVTLNSSVSSDLTAALKTATGNHNPSPTLLKLLLFLHTQSCQENQCSPDCREMRNVLDHMMTCLDGISCKVQDCISTKQTIGHWKSCTNTGCQSCLPVRDTLKNLNSGFLAHISLVKNLHEVYILTKSRAQSATTSAAVKMEITDEEVSPNRSDVAGCSGLSVNNNTQMKSLVKEEPMDHTEGVAEPIQTQNKDEPANNNNNLRSLMPEPIAQSGSTGEKSACSIKPDELKKVLVPTFQKLYLQHPESLPFRTPVDPVALDIPDYFDIVKKPMDLSTIKSKLDNGSYTDPWHYVDDVWLMFENAWLYNQEGTQVYGFCTELAKIFAKEIEPVMQALGYCEGGNFIDTMKRRLEVQVQSLQSQLDSMAADTEMESVAGPSTSTGGFTAAKSQSSRSTSNVDQLVQEIQNDAARFEQRRSATTTVTATKTWNVPNP